MRLTKEHIGKMVKLPQWDYSYQVLAISDGTWLIDPKFGGANIANRYTEVDDWEIVEPKKKPSERIRELTRPTYPGNLWQEQIDAIMLFLDEQAAEAGK